MHFAMMPIPGFKEDLCPHLGRDIQVFGLFFRLFFFPDIRDVLDFGPFFVGVFFVYLSCLLFVSRGISSYSNKLAAHIFAYLWMRYIFACHFSLFPHG